jgi:hypothetical protein
VLQAARGQAATPSERQLPQVWQPAERCDLLVAAIDADASPQVQDLAMQGEHGEPDGVARNGRSQEGWEEGWKMHIGYRINSNQL